MVEAEGLVDRGFGRVGKERFEFAEAKGADAEDAAFG